MFEHALGCTVSARFTSNLLIFYEWLLEACILTQACWSAPPLPERVSQKSSVNMQQVQGALQDLSQLSDCLPRLAMRQLWCRQLASVNIKMSFQVADISGQVAHTIGRSQQMHVRVRCRSAGCLQ